MIILSGDSPGDFGIAGTVPRDFESLIQLILKRGVESMQTEDMLKEIKQLRTIFNDMKRYIVDIQENLEYSQPKGGNSSEAFDTLKSRTEQEFQKISQYADTLKGILEDTQSLKSAFLAESEQAKKSIKSCEHDSIEQIRQATQHFKESADVTKKELSEQTQANLEKMQAAFEQLESLIAKKTEEFKKTAEKQQRQVLEIVEDNKQDLKKKRSENKWMITLNVTIMVFTLIVLFITILS